MKVRCCVCHKVRINQAWIEDPNPGGPFSATYCPVCVVAFRAQVVRSLTFPKETSYLQREKRVTQWYP